jgi:nickel-dependent lactate racemase
MEVSLPYGTQHRWVRVPEGTLVVHSPTTLPLADPHAAFAEAVKAPLETTALAAMVRPTDHVAIAISDITRPTPNHLLVPWILETLAFVPREQFVILVGNGSHRAMTHAELVQMLGEDIVASVPIVNHDATDASMLTYLGDTASGIPVWINRHYLAADVRIVTGFIEPHFFAGFSGGPKGAIPGLGGLATIQALHSAALIDHPRSTWMALDDNPIHLAIHETVALCPPEFLINVTLDPDHHMTGIYAGAYRAAHRAGCNALSQNAPAIVSHRFDVVITSNAGYPLDQNLYQSVKGMTAAARLVHPGGAIVLVAECRDGLPAHGAYQRLLMQEPTIEALLATIRQPGFQMADQWQVQKQALVQEQAHVYLHSSLADQVVQSTLLTPAPDLQAIVDSLLTAYGPHCRMAVLPEGPMTVMQVI